MFDLSRALETFIEACLIKEGFLFIFGTLRVFESSWIVGEIWTFHSWGLGELTNSVSSCMSWEVVVKRTNERGLRFSTAVSDTLGVINSDVVCKERALPFA